MAGMITEKGISEMQERVANFDPSRMRGAEFFGMLTIALANRNTPEAEATLAGALDFHAKYIADKVE